MGTLYAFTQSCRGLGPRLGGDLALRGRAHPTLVGDKITSFLGEPKLEIAPSLFPNLDSDTIKLARLLGDSAGTWILHHLVPVPLWDTDRHSRISSELCSHLQHSHLECLFSTELWGPCLFSCFHYRLPLDSHTANRPHLFLKNKQLLLVLQNNYLQKGPRRPIDCQP